MKYRKKPIEVEAFQYTGNFGQTPQWIVDAIAKGVLHLNRLSFETEPELFVDTLEGTHHVMVGDYIVKGVRGELYNCKPDIFEDTYEKEGKIDRSKWSNCPCNTIEYACCTCISRTCHKCVASSEYLQGNYCANCGKPLNENAWKELEERVER